MPSLCPDLHRQASQLPPATSSQNGRRALRLVAGQLGKARKSRAGAASPGLLDNVDTADTARGGTWGSWGLTDTPDSQPEEPQGQHVSRRDEARSPRARILAADLKSSENGVRSRWEASDEPQLKAPRQKTLQSGRDARKGPGLFGSTASPQSRAASTQASAEGFRASTSSWEDSDWGPGPVRAHKSWGSGAGRQAEPLEDPQRDPGLSSGSYGPNSKADYEPDITELTTLELDRLLPSAPTPEQISHCAGDSWALIPRLGLALLGVLLTTKSPLLAAASCTAPFWWPTFAAYRRNSRLRAGNRQSGLWCTEVLEVSEVIEQGRTAPGAVTLRMLRVLVGDPQGAQTELTFSSPGTRAVDIKKGQPAELLILTRDKKFQNFQAVRELYLPETASWLGEYPFISRPAYATLRRQLGLGEASPSSSSYYDSTYR